MADEGTPDVGGSVDQVRLTERLRLEPARREHADDLWRLHQDAGVARGHGGAYSREEAVQYAAACEEAWRTDGTSKWVVYRREDDALVGRGGVTRAMVDGEVRLEVGWTLLERWWGRGYATEIGRAGLDFAFDELEADEVVAFTEPHNARSLAVMERLGMGNRRQITHRGDPYVLLTTTRAG
jgi:ribosomal-protein-alanine N-acetyltransferase